MDIPVIYTTAKHHHDTVGDGDVCSSIKDSGSVASSTLSNWSASFRANFPFLVRHQQQYLSLTSTMMQQHRHRPCSTSDGYLSVDDEIDNDREEEERHHQAMEEKQNQISSCLHGNSNEHVNLWQLRELALSKGGLCNSDLRKRAWPKLLATHDHVLAHYDEKYYSATTSSLARRFENKQHKVSRKDALRIQQDIQHCMWHIEDHVTMARQQKEIREKMIWMKQQQQNEKRRQVTFQEPPNLVSAESPDNAEQPQQNQGGGESTGKGLTDLPLEVTTTTSRSSLSTSKNGGGESKHEDENDNDTYDIHSPMSAGGMMTPNSQSYYGSGMSLGSTSTITTAAAKRKPTSAHEQQILFNVLSNVFKSLPSNEDDQRYRYFSGLHDLTALILINLESPSLTSLVVSKLASYHLYDSLVLRRPNNRDEEINPQLQPTNGGAVAPAPSSFKSQEDDMVLLKAVLPLLEMVDLELYQFLQQSGTTLPTFCKSWIKCWFAQDVLDDIRVASRLIDVFLVSHVTMPIYVTVAMLTHPVNRSKILNSRCDLKSIHSTLKRLPTDLVLNEVHDPLDLVEDMIETALETLHTIPPSKLMATVTTMISRDTTMINKNEVVLDAPPLWVLSSLAPTDYGLLQQAKAMRNKLRSPASQEGGNDNENNNNNKSIKQQQELHLVSEEDGIREMYPLAATAVGLSKKMVSTNKFITKRIVIFVCLVGIAFMVVQMSFNSKNTADKSTATLQKQQPLEGPSTTGIFRRKKSPQPTKSSPTAAAATMNKKQSIEFETSTKLKDPKKTTKNATSSRKKEEREKKADTTRTTTKKEPSSPSTVKTDTNEPDLTQFKSQPVMSSVLPTPSKVSTTQSPSSSPLNPTVKENKQDKPLVQEQQQNTKAERQSEQKSRKILEVKELPNVKEEQPKKNKNILNKWFGARDNNKKKETNNNVSTDDFKTTVDSDAKKKKKKGPLSFFKRDKNNKKQKKKQSDEKKKNDNMFSML